jgi:hypothetical protein
MTRCVAHIHISLHQIFEGSTVFPALAAYLVGNIRFPTAKHGSQKHIQMLLATVSLCESQFLRTELTFRPRTLTINIPPSVHRFGVLVIGRQNLEKMTGSEKGAKPEIRDENEKLRYSLSLSRSCNVIMSSVTWEQNCLGLVRLMSFRHHIPYSNDITCSAMVLLSDRRLRDD